MSHELELEALVDAWRGPLVGFLSARGADRREAEELAQDVFAEAWLSRYRFVGDPHDETAVGRWLAGIARNLLRSERRRAGIQHATPSDELEGPEVSAADDEETLVALRRAVEGLPTQEREVVQAFYLEETSTAHVAALLEISPRAVEGRLRRARERLRGVLRRARQNRDSR